MNKRLCYLLGMFLAVQFAYAAPKEGQPSKESTWVKEVQKQKTALKKAFERYNFPYVSKVFHQGDAAEKLSFDVKGMDRLVLVTWGTEDGSGWDHASWAGAKLITNSGKEVWLDELPFEYAVAGWGKPQRNKNTAQENITIAGKEFEHGVFVHADGEVIIKLGKKYKRFETYIGLDDKANKNVASAVFMVQNKSAREIGNNLQESHPMLTESVFQFAGVDANAWLTDLDGSVEKKALENILKELDRPEHFQRALLAAEEKAGGAQLGDYLDLFSRAAKVYNYQKELAQVKPESIMMAVEDMSKDTSFDADKYKNMATDVAANFAFAQKGIFVEDAKAFSAVEEILAAKKEILLANPLLDMDKIIVVRHKLGAKARKVMGPGIGTQSNNWSIHTSQRSSGFDNEIVELSNLRGDIKMRSIYANPAGGAPLTNLVLHWDADKLLFTTIGSNNKWNIFEINTDGTGLKEMVDIEEKDVDFFDGCYLPNGKLMVNSTIGYHGVPCVDGHDRVGNLGVYDPKTKNYRRVNFGQDNDWSPVVMNNGRIMYLRWEYTDNTHYFSRIMMHMNPDGTNKKELYGSGSYWPNAMFDAKVLPGKENTQFVAIVSGHHGVARSGRMVTFDPKKGRQEDQGVMQEFPYRDRKIVPEVKDQLVNGVWPQFMKPQVLNENYYLVTAKMGPDALWGLYLIDTFDNVTPLAMFEGEAITEAVPVVKRETPPVIPEKVREEDLESTVFIQDIYEGRGTEGVPRGTIKELRILAYEFAYVKSPSNHMAQGIQSGWDIKRLLGTVPVEEDGSVMFKIPANIPISIQPVDAEGRAVQLMRSWLTGMPGETVSCVGCHEDQNTIAKPKSTIASRKQPQVITAPEGGVRSFTFDLEIQPILDRNCIACHDGSDSKPNFKDTSLSEGRLKFGKSYLALHPYVNRQGPEADIHTMKPMEYHASTSELIQKLEKGHHNVKLTDEEMRTLYNWIDFNAPYNGGFKSNIVEGVEQVNRRQVLMQKYNNVSIDWQKEIRDYATYLESKGEIETIVPEKEAAVKHKKVRAKNWPFTAEEAVAMQGDATKKTVEIAPGVALNLVKVPEGQFVMGSENGYHDEYPRAKVKVKEGFWMGEMEITNEQFKAIFPEHDSRYTAQFWKDHVNQGYASNLPEQPVIRVSWQEAMAFCEELSKRTGLKFTLPTEAQWEWAARAGSEEDFFYGDQNADFGAYANLADIQLRNMAVTGVNPKPMSDNHPYRPYFDFVPRSKTVDDGNMIAQEGKQYKANPWGIYDIIGNVKEWTRSDYASYPYKVKDGRNDGNVENKKVVRGGSWRDRPSQATSSYRTAYESWQKVYNVGFRVIVEE